MKIKQCKTSLPLLDETSLRKIQKQRLMPALFMLIISSLVLSSCSLKQQPPLTIADQYGLAYAPIEIMKQNHILEKYLPAGQQVEWVKLGNTAAIREAMLSGNLDIGFMGIPPFLIGLDNQMPWKMFTGLSSSPLGLVSNNPDVQALEDLIGKGKIALPQPGSIQHILLSMAAKKQLGNAKIFDNQLIALKHPDGYQALLNGSDVVAHFTAPPYLLQELQNEKFHQILSGNEAFGGEFTFIVGVCQEPLTKDKTKMDAFTSALKEALQFMNDSPDETIEILAKAYEMDVNEIKNQIKQEGMTFSTDINGTERFIGFMLETGYIKNEIQVEDTSWGN